MRYGGKYVCSWHKADVQLALTNVCFEGKTDMTRT